METLDEELTTLGRFKLAICQEVSEILPLLAESIAETRCPHCRRIHAIWADIFLASDLRLEINGCSWPAP